MSNLSPYGFCPICHAQGKSRERRLNGNDKCVNGHTYPSKDAVENHLNTNTRPNKKFFTDRIFKFRAWDKRNNTWLHNFKQMGGINLFGETIVLGGWLDGVSVKDWDEIIVQQFTGLFDSKGREVYEGDTVNFRIAGIPHGPSSEYYQNQIVKYDPEILAFTFGSNEYTILDRIEDIEVVGNIYENS